MVQNRLLKISRMGQRLKVSDLRKMLKKNPNKFSLLKPGKASMWQGLIQMGEGTIKILQERLEGCLGAWGGVYDKHFLSSLKASKKDTFSSEKEPALTLGGQQHSWSSIHQGPHHPETSITVNLNDSLPTMTELSGGGTFSQVNHRPLWQHPSLSMLQLHHPTFALCPCSILLVLPRYPVTIHVSC